MGCTSTNIQKSSHKKILGKSNEIIDNMQIIKNSNHKVPLKRIPPKIPNKKPLFLWTNQAEVSWPLELKTNNEYICLDCPYPDTSFKFKIENSNVISFHHMNMEFVRLSNASDIIVGEYEYSPNENGYHKGKIEILDTNFDLRFLSKEYLVSSNAYKCYEKFGIKLEDLQTQYILALDTFLKCEEFLKTKKYEEGYDLIENYFSYFIPAKKLVYIEWLNGKFPSLPNFGTPVTYYSLLIMREIFEYHVNIKPFCQTPSKIPYVWTTVLIGESRGYHAESLETLDINYGEELTNKINPELLKSDYKIIKDSFFLFSEYLHVISLGRLDVKMNIIYLNDSSVKCGLKSKIEASCFNSKMFFCEMSPGWDQQMYPKLTEEVKSNTDVYWVLWPDHRPIKNDKLNKVNYITGGCCGGKIPVLICHDTFLTNYFGNGGLDFHVYSDEERRAYLPQWLHHEFSHYLFGSVYPEYKLEVRGHDWFDRKLWPEDFEGTTEPDYYEQALNKRLKTCSIPIWDKLKWQVDLSSLDINLLCGNYECNPVENDWHVITITKSENFLLWTNKANVSWKLIPDLKKGKLLTQNDCPYFNMLKSVEIIPVFSENIVTGISSLNFFGPYYKKD